MNNERHTLLRKKEAHVLDFGKLPPQAKELEECVLGALLIISESADEVCGFLTPEMFYADAHVRIYNAIQQLYNEQSPIDIMTVTERLKKNADLDACGGYFYVVQLTNKVGSAANIEYHARIIQEKFMARQVISACTEAISEAYDDTNDSFEVLDRIQQRIFSVSENNNAANIQTLVHTVDTALHNLDNPEDQEKDGCKSYFKNVDAKVPGFLNGENIVIAARPGMGKTAFVLQLARNIAAHGKSVAFFSLEMQRIELAKRMLAAESGVALDRIIRNTLDESERIKLKTARERLRTFNLLIDDTASQKPLQILSTCRKLKRTQHIGAVIIDYMQLMDAYDGKRKFDNTDAEVSYISQSIKRIAKSIDVPVFVLSQLNRNVETRGGDKRPMLSDLRNSGSIEQDADKVLFLYRPEYYGITTDDKGNDVKGICEVIIAKQRNGALGTAILNFDGKHQKFSDR